MTRFVIEPGVALALAQKDARVPKHHTLLAPTLLRSQVLAELYVRVQHGGLTKQDASRHLDYLRGLQIRLLGDRVLQRVAWDIAQELGWDNTFVAEYLALTKLQGDALVTLDPSLAAAAKRWVAVATLEELLVSPAAADPRPRRPAAKRPRPSPG